MERSEGMKLPGVKEEFLKEKQPVKLILIFHLIGLIGFLIPALNPIFLKLVPWHLLFMFAILLYSHQSDGKKLTFFILIVYALGYAAEWSGVNRHWFFGNYYYGRTLGVKLNHVPLIIGINWFLLTYSAGVLMQRSRLKYMLIRIIIGAAILVLLDLLIEPVAVYFDYWRWENAAIPLKNYVCWFAISCVMLTLFEVFKFKKQSIIAPVFLVTQFVFFAILFCSDN